MWRSSGSSPAPWVGVSGPEVVSNGLAKNVLSARKKPTSTNSVACAHGTTSRILLRVRNSARLAQPLNSITHSSSDPCWVAQIAATR